MADKPGAGLQINQDLRYQQWEWQFQRYGRGLMLLVVLAALLGLMGQGPLSSARTSSADGTLHLEYERFLRFHSPAQLRLRVTPGAERGGELRVWIEQEFLNRMQVQSVLPEPLRVEAGPDRQTFVFRVTEPARPTTILFHIEPDERGPLSSRLGIDGAEPVAFSQFVYP